MRISSSRSDRRWGLAYFGFVRYLDMRYAFMGELLRLGLVYLRMLEVELLEWGEGVEAGKK